MRRLWVVIPLGTLAGVMVILAALYGIYRLWNLDPEDQGPSAASAHRAITRAVDGLKARDEREFLSAADWGNPAMGKRAWRICSAAFDLNPRITGDNSVSISAIGILVAVPGDGSKGCSVGLEWSVSDWLNHRGWAFVEAAPGSD